MDDSELSAFIVQYSNQRSSDLARPIPAEDDDLTYTPKTKKRPAPSTVLNLTPEQMEIMKKLKLI